MSGDPAAGTVPWTLILDRARPGWENMAVDAALLDRAREHGERFLRLYQWDPHCLSFGRHEPARKRYDVDRIRARNIPCVRRPTGGRAVWHARELTYAVAAPLAAFGGMREAYAAIHALLATALEALGAHPRLAPRASPAPGLTSGPCFAMPVGGEVIVQDRKVVGSAQLRSGDAFLQHGSMLLEDDQQLVRELAGISGGAPKEAALASLIGGPVAFSDAAAAVRAAAEALFEDVELSEGLPGRVSAGVAGHAGQFQSPEWTWAR